MTEQQQIVGEAQKGARDILTETRAALEAQAAATLAELRGKVDGLSARLADRLLKG